MSLPRSPAAWCVCLIVTLGCGGTDTSNARDAGTQDSGNGPCAVSNGGCSTTPMVTCTVSGSVAACGACPVGYTGNGRTCASVSQVNECAIGTDNCSVNADCTDTTASFSCSCKPGYAGDGVSCTKVGCSSAAECSDGISCTNDTCAPSGMCLHAIVPALCAAGSSCNPTTGCVAGHACGQPSDCIDSDPCTRNETCNGTSATCTYTLLDNDGDGEPPLVCGGTDCNDADAGVGGGKLELCGNSLDDDCDGLVDTDATVTSDPSLRSDENNCGTCGVACTNASQTCFQGQCVSCGQSPGATCCDAECSSGTSCTGGYCSASNLDCGITGGTAQCTNCGSIGSHCCDGSACAAGGACVAGSCVSCGGVGQPCCASQTCNAGGACSSGACVACGGVGQPCCAGSTCGSNSACVTGSCVACGGAGQPCCTGSTCGSGAICSGGTCAACGANTQLCCQGNSCAASNECGDLYSGFYIRPGLCHPTSCGDRGEPCCTLGCTEGAACGGATCGACGGEGEACCPYYSANTRGGCFGSAHCESSGGTSTCLTCGLEGEACCPGGVCGTGSCSGNVCVP